MAFTKVKIHISSVTLDFLLCALSWLVGKASNTTMIFRQEGFYPVHKERQHWAASLHGKQWVQVYICGAVEFSMTDSLELLESGQEAKPPEMLEMPCGVTCICADVTRGTRKCCVAEKLLLERGNTESQNCCFFMAKYLNTCILISCSTQRMYLSLQM